MADVIEATTLTHRHRGEGKVFTPLIRLRASIARYIIRDYIFDIKTLLNHKQVLSPVDSVNGTASTFHF